MSGRGVAFVVAAIVLAALFIAPLFWALASSVKTPPEAAAIPPTWLPSSISFKNYSAVEHVGAGGILEALTNSALVTSLSILLTLVFSTLAGYSFSRWRFPLKNIVFLVILLPLMIPFQSVIIPLYLLLGKIHLLNSLVGLAIIYATFQLPFATFVMRNTFDQVPRQLDEAAHIDGASSVTTLLRILVPLSVPGLATVALFTFLAAWNELLAALVFLNDAHKFTIPVLLSLVEANQFGAVNWGALQAGVVIAMAPCIVIFLILQRYYSVKLAVGAIKG
jgi:multiple sugar transport system permease protein